MQPNQPAGAVATGDPGAPLILKQRDVPRPGALIDGFLLGVLHVAGLAVAREHLGRLAPERGMTGARRPIGSPKQARTEQLVMQPARRSCKSSEAYREEVTSACW
jgi:hypothetical protein